jgi:Mg2+-importing ATPase
MNLRAPWDGWRMRLSLALGSLAGLSAGAAAWSNGAEAWTAGGWALGASALAGAAAWSVMKRLTVRARRLADQAERWDPARPGVRLPEVGTGAELDRLARAFNSIAARLEATLAETQRFTSDASHELRTPLTALRAIGAVALQDTRDPENLRAALGEMLEVTARMNRLIDQLLLLARSDADALPAQLTEVSVPELLHEVAESVRVVAEERSQRLVVEAPEGMTVRADAEWLRVALMNLVQNALRHGPSGSSVIVSAIRRGYEGVIEVTDEGPGIAAEHHERIFERFYRVDKSRARAEGGVGLGLAIAKWAVERSGGGIGLRSAPGAGATFSIRLPAAPGPPAAEDSFRETSDEPPARGAHTEEPEMPTYARPPGFSDLREAATLPLAEVLARLGSSERGLSWSEADDRRRAVGPNLIAADAAPLFWQLLWSAAATPFNGILLGLAVVSLLTHDYPATVVMLVMVALGTTLRVWQERKSRARVTSLMRLVRPKVTVWRTGHAGPPDDVAHPLGPGAAEVPVEELVPGDVIGLRAGDQVPADARVLQSTDLFLSQSLLTGEAMPVEKFAVSSSASRPGGATAGLFDLPNMLCTGATVVSGEARALVLATGRRSFLGGMAASVATPRGPTAFDAGVNQVSWLLIRFMLVMLPTVFLLNGLLKGEWGGAFFFAIAVAVGLTPEMLPMIVNVNLARGVAALARRRVLVKRLAALHDLGAMEVLCTDKTGTLTRDEVEVAAYLDAWGESSGLVLQLAYLNSIFQTGVKNLPDRALIAAAEAAGLRLSARDFTKVEELPFDYTRRRATVLVREARGDHRYRVICKGAVAEVVELCTEVETPAGPVRLDAAERRAIDQRVAQLESQGLRVLAVASRTLDRPVKLSARCEGDLVLAGMVAFRDPPREETSAALRRWTELGVDVKILTGDNPGVARALAAELGLTVHGEMQGPDVANCPESELVARARGVTIFARLTPPQKARVVRALRTAGAVTGFLGDGINDAPALRAADVGIAVAAGADVALEAADVILLEKDLGNLAAAVEEGRRTYGNIVKYIKMAASSNFGNALAVLSASLWLPFLPMRPLQLLLQNLLYDAAQTSIPWDRVDHEFLRRPQRWDARGIGRFMLCIGPLSTAFDLLAFAFLWWVLGVATSGDMALFHSGWFVVGLLTQTLIVHVLRTGRVPFVESVATRPVWVMTGLAMAAGLWLPFSPFADWLGFTALPAAFWIFLPVCLLGYALVVQAAKHIYIRRTGGWL